MSIFKKIVKFLILLIVFLMFYSANWLINNYGGLNVNELLFHLFSPLGGTEKSLVQSYFSYNVVRTLVTTIAVFVPVEIVLKEINK